MQNYHFLNPDDFKIIQHVSVAVYGLDKKLGL